MDEIRYTPIGIVRSPFTALAGMPLQTVAAPDVVGRIEIFPDYEAGLRDLDGFSHVHLLTHLHRSGPGDLEVVPFLDDEPHGVFATRAPGRPNPLGLSVVRLLEVAGTTLRIAGLDLLDGTPVLDLKPYVPHFDHVDAERIGWFEGKSRGVHAARADDRFAQ